MRYSITVKDCTTLDHNNNNDEGTIKELKIQQYNDQRQAA
jgi:hypothetical protein